MNLFKDDLEMIFQIFDKNLTGLIDWNNWFEESMVPFVPGIYADNIKISDLIKHTISLNYALNEKKNESRVNFAKNITAISQAFQEINTSNTGEITLEELRIALFKNQIYV